MSKLTPAHISALSECAIALNSSLYFLKNLQHICASYLEPDGPDADATMYEFIKELDSENQRLLFANINRAFAQAVAITSNEEEFRKLTDSYN